MEKVRRLDGSDYLVYLYSGKELLGSRKVYYNCGKYYVYYSGRYGEVLDFNLDGKPLTCVFVDELFFY